MVNGSGFGSKVADGAGLALGASLMLGGISILAHITGFIPHEFVLGGGMHRGCCSKHPKHHCGGCPDHGKPMHHRGYESLAGTMNTLGPGGDGRYHLY